MRSEVTLADSCKEIVDCEHRTAPIDPSGEYFAVGTPAMRGNVINLDQSRPINQATFETWTRRLRPRYGDLLFAREAPVGPVVRIPPEENVAPGQRTVLLRPNPDVVDTNYLYYLLSSPKEQALIAAKAAGSTVAHLNVADVRSFPLPPLPGIAEQRGIAEVLGALDDKISANSRLQATIDQLVQALFIDATAGAEAATLGAVADVNLASVKPTAGELRYLDIASVSVGTYASPAASPWSSAPGRARRKISTGDTVWSTVRPNRRSHALILEDDQLLVGSTGLAVLTPKRGRFAYVYEATRTEAFTAYLEAVAEGSAYPAVRGDRFAQAPVPLPVESRIIEFEAAAGPLRMRAGAALAESAALVAMRDALLPLLMSGKVTIKDAKSVVGEVL